jgi:hypothetical protein
MATDYVTKKDLDSALDNALNSFADRIAKAITINIEAAEERILETVKQENRQYCDENMTRFDEVVGELQNMREDNMIGTYQMRELRENVDDYEKRIKKLETS